MPESSTTTGLSDDSYLVATIAATWLLTASLYHLLPMLDMPPGQRVWGASAVFFGLLAALILWVELNRRPS